MFNRSKEMLPKNLHSDHKCTINLIDFGSKVKSATPRNVYACIQVNNKKIFLAPHSYAKTLNVGAFYIKHNIATNIDLRELAHGTREDSYSRTMPHFISAVDEISQSFVRDDNGAVLVNCQNGRSRTSTVVALYLMSCHRLTADSAIGVVNAVLKKKGLKLLEEQSGPNGNYADWLRHYEATNKLLISPAVKKRKRISIFERLPGMKDAYPAYYKRELEYKRSKANS